MSFRIRSSPWGSPLAPPTSAIAQTADPPSRSAAWTAVPDVGDGSSSHQRRHHRRWRDRSAQRDEHLSDVGEDARAHVAGDARCRHRRRPAHPARGRREIQDPPADGFVIDYASDIKSRRLHLRRQDLHGLFAEAGILRERAGTADERARCSTRSTTSSASPCRWRTCSGGATAATRTA